VAARSKALGLRPLAYWDCGIEFRREYGYLSVVSVVCCQVEVSVSVVSVVCCQVEVSVSVVSVACCQVEVSVCVVSCVLSGRSLCVGLISRLGKSCRVACVPV
jgi:hypothetical protein